MIGTTRPAIDVPLKKGGKAARVLITSVSTPMASSTKTFRARYLRVLLCIAALFALCTSNNVGLSFLPLPLAGDHQTLVQKLIDREQLSGAPSQYDSQSVRIPIASFSQKREAKQTVSQPLAGTPKFSAVISITSQVRADYDTAVHLDDGAFGSQPPGRAPPSLI